MCNKHDVRSFSLYEGPSIKYVMLFLANFDPPSLCHTLSHIPGPQKYVTHLGPPIFSRPSKKPGQSPLYKFSLNCSSGFLSGGFCYWSFVWKVLSGVVFVRSPFCRNT